MQRHSTISTKTLSIEKCLYLINLLWGSHHQGPCRLLLQGGMWPPGWGWEAGRCWCRSQETCPCPRPRLWPCSNRSGVSADSGPAGWFRSKPSTSPKHQYHHYDWHSAHLNTDRNEALAVLLTTNITYVFTYFLYLYIYNILLNTISNALAE